MRHQSAGVCTSPVALTIRQRRRHIGQCPSQDANVGKLTPSPVARTLSAIDRSSRQDAHPFKDVENNIASSRHLTILFCQQRWQVSAWRHRSYWFSSMHPQLWVSESLDARTWNWPPNGKGRSRAPSSFTMILRPAAFLVASSSVSMTRRLINQPDCVSERIDPYVRPYFESCQSLCFTL